MDLIYGCGPEKGIFFLEDYPSEEEFHQKKPLIGSNLSLLKRLLYPLHRNPESFYRTAFFKARQLELQPLIRRNKFRWHSKQWLTDKKYFEDMLDMVLAEILEIQPRIIFVCGELPLNALTERRKIRKFRGSVLEFADWIKVKYPQLTRTLLVPIIPLRDQFADPLLQVFSQLDLQKGLKYEKEQFVHPDKRYILTVANSAADFYGFLERCRYPEYRTIDIETNNNFITCIGFCLDGKEAISVPWIHMRPEHRATLMKAVANYIAQPVPTVNQNIIYDDTVLDRWGMVIPNIIGDTMMLSHTMYPEFPKGLDFLTSIYTDNEYYKDDVKDVGDAYDPEKYKERLYLYNAKDALNTHIIYKQQVEDAKELGVFDFYNKMVMPLYPCYKRINNTGIRIDESKRRFLLKKYISKFETAFEYLRSLIGDAEEEINWNTFINSSEQVGFLVYTYMGCPEIKHWTVSAATGERKQVLSTDEDTLEELMINRVKEEPIKKVLLTLIICRKYFRIINWLTTPYDYDGRMYTSYNQVGTESGRTSASECATRFRLLEDTDGYLYKKPVGYSFQTIPKHGYELPDGRKIGNDLLEIFIPDDGYIFIEGDKSQAEARVVTVLSENYKLLPIFDKPPGIHRLTASWIVGGDPFNIKKTDTAYDKGKRARHAGNYGMRPGRLSQMTHLPYSECEVILFKFHHADPSIRDVFHKGIKEALNKDRVLITPLGRRREFFGRLDEDTYKEAYSYIPQSTVGDDIKRGMKDLMALAPWAQFQIEKHDSVLASVPKETRDDYVEIWNKTMQKPIDFRQCTLMREFELVIPTELQWSDTNLSELRDLK